MKRLWEYLLMCGEGDIRNEEALQLSWQRSLQIVRVSRR